MKKTNNFVLITDMYGTLIEKIPSEERDIVKKGENVLKIIAPQSHNLFFDFIKNIKEEKYIMGYEIDILEGSSVKQYILHGFLKDEKINITFYADEGHTSEMLTEIIKINNLQINELRKKYKEESLKKAKLEEDVYIEITKLNNELLNSKRTIEKQNAQLSKYNALLEDLAMKDPLTGAYNRRYFYEKTPDLSEKIALTNGRMHFTAIDLNYFKKLNDHYGHDFGDRILKSLVSLMEKYKGKEDLVFRIGGDEFLIVFVNKSKSEIESIMGQIEEGYKEATDISSISYGISEIDLVKDKRLDTRRIDFYLKKADRLMYNHKAKVKSYGEFKSST